MNYTVTLFISLLGMWLCGYVSGYRQGSGKDK